MVHQHFVRLFLSAIVFSVFARDSSGQQSTIEADQNGSKNKNLALPRAKAVIQNWDLANWKRLGWVELEQMDPNLLRISGTLHGMKPGLHGFHIHVVSDLENGCKGAGPHFNPEGPNHGGPKAEIRHHGDFGNIVADQYGVANFTIIDSTASLIGPNSVVGRTFVVHADEDDLGLGGNEESLKTGNAGARIGCGVIGLTSNGPMPLSGFFSPQQQIRLQQPGSTGSVAECRDVDRPEYCAAWKQMGYCQQGEKYNRFMEDNCRRTCFYC